MITLYRVFDTKKRKWVTEKAYLASDDKVYIEKQSIFGWKRLVLDNHLVCHRDIGMHDKNGKLVFEGDYIKATVGKDKVVVGLVTFAHEMSGYILLCSDSSEWFSLGSDITEFTEVFGNVFDGRKDKEYGEPTL